MFKKPLIAVAIAIIAAVVIFLFLDIRPPKNTEIVQSVDFQSDIVPVDYILAFNESLDEENRNYADSLINLFESSPSAEESLAAIEALIKFYEENQQFNFAAWLHTPKARLNPSHDAWALAGARQYSVSQNDAYEADFNEFLRIEAIQSYRTAIELDSSVLDTRVKLASCYLDRSAETMMGVTMLLSVVEEDSMHVNANLLLGRFGIVSSQFDKAVKRLENVLSLQPENTEALFLIGEAYLGMGEKEKAVEAFLKCKELIESEQLKKELDQYILEILS
jgi:tetratricopeptide (TPR) repeat protein